MFFVVLLLWTSVWAAGQTPADLYALEEYRSWLARQTAEVRGGDDVLDKYREHLIGMGLDHADAESQVRVIRELEATEEPPACLVKTLKGRKAGKALDGTGNGAWLQRQGWQVTTGGLGKGRWDLVLVRGGKDAPSPPRLRAALLPGGVAIAVDGAKCAVTR